jgi:hypothetical protein
MRKRNSGKENGKGGRFANKIGEIAEIPLLHKATKNLSFSSERDVGLR